MPPLRESTELRPMSRSRAPRTQVTESRIELRAARGFESQSADVLLSGARRDLDKDDPVSALDKLDRARRRDRNRRADPDGAAFVERLRGEAYFALEQWSLAYRYLEKSRQLLPQAASQETIARLVASARNSGDALSANRQQARLRQPLSSAAKKLLETSPRRVASASRPRYGRREPISVAPAPTPAALRQPRGARSGPRAASALRQVLPRSAWSARPTSGKVTPMGTVRRITVHHTGDKAVWLQPRAQVASMIRGIQRYHQNNQRWADIGYHYLIDRSGVIWQGRPSKYQGAHAGGRNNRGNLGIALLGNYLKQRPSRAQIESLGDLVTMLTNHFGLSAGNVYTHGEIAGGRTTCPGPVLARYVRELRETLRLRSSMAD